MLKVGIDAHWLVSHPFKSIAVYLATFLEGCVGLRAPDIELNLYLPSAFEPAGPHAELLRNPRFRVRRPQRPFHPTRSYKHHLLWNQVGLPWLARRDGADVLFLPYHLTPLLYPGIVVTTIHDICVLSHGNCFGKTDKLFLGGEIMTAVRKAKRFIAVSDFTGRELAQMFPRLRSRISIVYPGLRSRCCGDVLREESIPEPFFLWIGHRGRRKRFDLILEAFAAYKRSGERAESLLLVVPKNEAEFFAAVAQEYGIRENVAIRSEISEAMKRALLTQATALVFPSECEGFGLPVFEAMLAGGLPLVSTQGPAADFLPAEVPRFSQMSAGAVQQLMVWAATLPPYERVDLSIKVRAVARQFGPAVMAEGMFTAFREAAGLTRAHYHAAAETEGLP